MAGITSNNTSLTDLLSDLNAVTKEVESLLLPLKNSQLNWSSEAGRWSIGQCVSHLTITANQYFPMMDKSLERSSAAAEHSSKQLRPSIFGRLFLLSFSPKFPLKLKSPRKFIPLKEVDKSVLGEFLKTQEELGEYFKRAGTTEVRKVNTNSPVSKLLPLSFGDCLLILVRHEQHHLKQMIRVREHELFPSD